MNKVYIESSIRDHLAPLVSEFEKDYEVEFVQAKELNSSEELIPKKNICFISSDQNSHVFFKNNLNIYFQHQFQNLDLFTHSEEEKIQDGVIKLDFKNTNHDITNLVRLYFEQIQLKRIHQLQSCAFKNLKKLIAKIKTKAVDKGLKKLTKEMQVLNQKVLSYNHRSEVEHEIEQFLNKKGLIEKFQYDLQDEVGEKEHIFPVEIGENEFIYFLLHLKSMPKAKLYFIVISLINILSSFEKRNLYLKNLSDKVFKWGEIFSELPFPVALFNKKGDLVHHNNFFLNLKLLSSECFELKNNSEFERDRSSYKVLRQNYTVGTDDYDLFVFIEGTKKITEVDTEQLGIITSSVAHELNNPLSGILAALGLLETILTSEEEKESFLQDMKDSTLRCKQLVETFLGFSRYDLHKVEGNLSTSMEQALHLMRFRMIESNVKISLKSLLDEKGDKEFMPFENSSIMTMVFYLLFGDLMTSYSHFMLLTFNQNRTQNLIEVEYWGDEGTIVLNIGPEFEFANLLLESKLLNFLLKLEGFELTIDKNQILFHSTKNRSLGNCQ
jgi:hypothetical protein